MDIFIFKLINGFAGKWWIFDWLGIFFAKYSGYLMILVAIFILLKQRDWRDKIYFFALSGLSFILARGLIVEIIRFFYYRPRPFLSLQIHFLINHASTGSFPSGHAAAYFSLAIAIFYFLKQKHWNKEDISLEKPKLGLWMIGLAFLISLSRIFVGVHWPIDILAGVLIGFISVLLINKILPKPKEK
ncbi:phosphatase PAP2 family protein [Candidatus Wolfebacteria bacterium]|nr:phosphatase PAP2 family protein [Candidatus Wolfebacteria bacterium]